MRMPIIQHPAASSTQNSLIMQQFSLNTGSKKEWLKVVYEGTKPRAGVQKSVVGPSVGLEHDAGFQKPSALLLSSGLQFFSLRRKIRCASIQILMLPPIELWKGMTFFPCCTRVTKGTRGLLEPVPQLKFFRKTHVLQFPLRALWAWANAISLSHHFSSLVLSLCKAEEQKAHKELWLQGVEEYISNNARYCMHGIHACGELSSLWKGLFYFLLVVPLPFFFFSGMGTFHIY